MPSDSVGSLDGCHESVRLAVVVSLAADPEVGSEGRPLVLDGQRSHTRRWCEVGSGSSGLRIVTSDGGIYRPACKRRDCPRCWARRSRETARCLVLDARQEMPTHCLTLTTQKPWQELEPAEYRQASAAVFQRLRRRYGAVEYFGAIEFTTGHARRSGGHRRLHGHYLLKFRGGASDGGTRIDVVETEALIRETWQRSTGAYVVELAELVTPGAALGYLGLHHRKPSQAPPAPWIGKTERASLGYWSRPIAELREQARRELAVEAIAHRHELPLEVAELELALRGGGRLIDTRQRHGATLRESLGEVRR